MNWGAANDPQDEWMAAVFRSRAEHSRARNDCPSPERIWDAIRLQLPIDERLGVVDHISECPTCAEAWTIAAELVTAHEDIEPPTVAASEQTGVYGRTAILIAAPVLLVVALGIALIVFRPASPPATVSTESGLTVRPSPAQTAQTPVPVPAPAPQPGVSETRSAAQEQLEVTRDRERLAQRAPRVTTTPDIPLSLPVESDENAIRRVIATYKMAIESGDVSLFLTVVPGISATQQERLGASFQFINAQQVTLTIEDLQVTGTSAVARISRKDVVIVEGEHRQSGSSRQTLHFEKSAAGWIITSIGP